MYRYFSNEGADDDGNKTLCTLYRGYNHWESTRVDKIEVNGQNHYFCFVRCVVTPSMKPASYKVNLVLSCENGYERIKIASCQCAAE